jgi:hypothetical protein
VNTDHDLGVSTSREKPSGWREISSPITKSSVGWLGAGLSSVSSHSSLLSALKDDQANSRALSIAMKRDIRHLFFS